MTSFRQVPDRAPVCLDHNASSPWTPEVAAWLASDEARSLGNPSSLHAAGRRAREVIETARQQVALALNAEPRQIVLCGGGTEASNLAIQSLRPRLPGVLAVSAVEHPAVLRTCQALAAETGSRLLTLPVDGLGRLLPLDLPDDTRLVAVMAANNETGTCYDVPAVATAGRAVGAWVHCDAVQALGKVPVDAAAWGVDSLAISGHKFGAPQGTGALYLRDPEAARPLLHGGGQEGGLRSGTENAAGLAALGRAIAAVHQDLAGRMLRMREARDAFERHVLSRLDRVRVLGDPDQRVPNTACLAIAGVKGEAIVFDLDAQGVAVSTGSACSSGSGKASHVLVAMGVTKPWLDGVLRVSTGPETTVAQALDAAERLVQTVRRLRVLAGETAILSEVQ